MDQKKYSLNEHTKEYFSISKEKVIQSRNNLQSTVNSFSDQDGQIILTMDNTQIIHSISISEKLLVASDKKEIMDRLTRFINVAIIGSGKNTVHEMQNAVSTDEFNKILSEENKGVRGSIELLMKKNNQAIREFSSMKRTIASTSGNITVSIFGNRMIHSLSINNEFLSVKNKSIIEKELMETINKASQEILEEIQGLMKTNEEEFNKTIIQE